MESKLESKSISINYVDVINQQCSALDAKKLTQVFEKSKVESCKETGLLGWAKSLAKEHTISKLIPKNISDPNALNTLLDFLKRDDGGDDLVDFQYAVIKVWLGNGVSYHWEKKALIDTVKFLIQLHISPKSLDLDQALCDAVTKNHMPEVATLLASPNYTPNKNIENAFAALMKSKWSRETCHIAALLLEASKEFLSPSPTRELISIDELKLFQKAIIWRSYELFRTLLECELTLNLNRVLIMVAKEFSYVKRDYFDLVPWHNPFHDYAIKLILESPCYAPDENIAAVVFAIVKHRNQKAFQLIFEMLGRFKSSEKIFKEEDSLTLINESLLLVTRKNDMDMMIEGLLKMGADIHWKESALKRRRWSSLDLSATYYSESDTFPLMLGYSKNPSGIQSTILTVAQDGRIDALRMILAYAKKEQLFEQNPDFLNWLYFTIGNSQPLYALDLVVRRLGSGDPHNDENVHDMIELLLEHGSNPYHNNGSAIIAAARGGYSYTVGRMVLGKEISPKIKYYFYIILRNCSLQIFKQLIEKARDSGIFNDFPAILNEPCDPSVYGNEDRMTLLQAAVLQWRREGAIQRVDFLLQQGASLTAPSQNGITALEIAMRDIDVNPEMTAHILYRLVSKELEELGEEKRAGPLEPIEFKLIEKVLEMEVEKGRKIILLDYFFTNKEKYKLTLHANTIHNIMHLNPEIDKSIIKCLYKFCPKVGKKSFFWGSNADEIPSALNVGVGLGPVKNGIN